VVKKRRYRDNPLHHPLNKPLRRVVKDKGEEWVIYLQPPGKIGFRKKGTFNKFTVWFQLGDFIESARIYVKQKKARLGLANKLKM
jgi:hypothetical protein